MSAGRATIEAKPAIQLTDGHDLSSRLEPDFARLLDGQQR